MICGGAAITRLDPSETTAALIVAAGRGRRMGEALPKQFVPLCGRPILARTLAAFLLAEEIDHIAVVIHPDDHALYGEAVGGINDPRLKPPVHGGATRSESVRLGLLALAAGTAPAQVLIHDAARPFVSVDVIGRVIDGLHDADGAFAAIPIVDALWTNHDGHAGNAVPRDGLWRAQTPQGFHFDKILKAHLQSDGTAADDVAVARDAGLNVRIVQGHNLNFKITTPADLARAEQALAEQ